MNISLKAQALHPQINWSDPNKGFRHPQHGLNNCPTIADWDAVMWPEVYDDNNDIIPKPTKQQLIDQPYPADYQIAELKAGAAATIAGYTYQGVAFDLESKLAYYEGVARKAAGGLLDGLYPVRLIGTDGIVSAADAAEVAAAYADMEAFWMGVQITLGAQIEAVLNG